MCQTFLNVAQKDKKKKYVYPAPSNICFRFTSFLRFKKKLQVKKLFWLKWSWRKEWWNLNEKYDFMQSVQSVQSDKPLIKGKHRFYFSWRRPKKLNCNLTYIEFSFENPFIQISWHPFFTFFYAVFCYSFHFFFSIEKISRIREIKIWNQINPKRLQF